MGLRARHGALSLQGCQLSNKLELQCRAQSRHECSAPQKHQLDVQGGGCGGVGGGCQTLLGPTSKTSMEGWWMVHTTVRPVLTLQHTQGLGFQQHGDAQGPETGRLQAVLKPCLYAAAACSHQAAAQGVLLRMAWSRQLA